jgi:hypothetical protein
MKIIQKKYSETKDILFELFSNQVSEMKEYGPINLNLDINHSFYIDMEIQGSHVGFIIESDLGKPIGYLSIFINKHHHYNSTVFAITDCFFIDKKYRGIRSYRSLIDCFKTAESVLRNQYNVRYFYLGANINNSLKFLADTLAFEKAEVIYVKDLAG